MKAFSLNEENDGLSNIFLELGLTVKRLVSFKDCETFLRSRNTFSLVFYFFLFDSKSILDDLV